MSDEIRDDCWVLGQTIYQRQRNHFLETSEAKIWTQKIKNNIEECSILYLLFFSSNHHHVWNNCISVQWMLWNCWSSVGDRFIGTNLFRNTITTENRAMTKKETLLREMWFMFIFDIGVYVVSSHWKHIMKNNIFPSWDQLVFSICTCVCIWYFYFYLYLYLYFTQFLTRGLEDVCVNCRVSWEQLVPTCGRAHCLECTMRIHTQAYILTCAYTYTHISISIHIKGSA